MLTEGVLEAAGERPAAAYGLHVFSDTFGRGVLAARPGPVMAASDTLDVTVVGRGGHGSTPHRAADPVAAACAMVTALQTLVTRRFDVFDPVVITVGAFHAGTWSNIIPGEAVFQATVRSFSRQSRDRLREETLRLVRSIAEAHAVTVNARYVEGYPVTVNDPAEAAFATATAAGLFGADRSRGLANPLPGAEDFSYVLNQVPGAFVLLGACPPGTDPGTAPSNHSPAAVFDDSVLADGTALYAELALRRLTGASLPA